MWSNEIHLALKNVVEIHHQEERRSSSSSSDSSQEDVAAAPQGSIGGFYRDGSLGWTARGSLFEVFCTKSGAKLVSHSFDQDSKTRNCVICSAEEVQLNETSCCVVAVVIQLENDSSVITLLTVQGCRILGRIDVHEKLTCLKPISKLSYSRGRIAEYNGCMAVGTASGKVLLIDTCLKYEENPIFGRRLVMNKVEKNQCHIEFSSTDLDQIAASHALVRDRNVYFGLQLDAVGEEDSPVISLIDLPALMAIAVGFADGRIAIYDLLELRVIHVAYPAVEDSPVVSMNLVEPTDDPKACVYIWAFHASEDGAFAVMHTLMYEEKYVESHGHVYEGFISCSTRLTIPCHDKGSFPLNVQSIMKTVSQEEEVLTLCVLSWVGSDKSTNIVVFDLNQWYKAEMPRTSDWRHNLNHTVVFNVKDFAVNVCLVADSLVPFNSIQRPEEHFYPNSLSFDIIALNNDNCARYHWTGLQNKILDYFEKSGSACIMDPGKIYNIMLRAALMPQFVDYNFTSESPLDVQREYLLSVALEYNCYSLLQECAINWADGSHLGQNPEEGVSLSTLTEWIWSRAKALKELSNNMCIPLFDLSGRRIDCGTQKTLLHCSRQLRQLTKLYDVIFTQCKQYIPSKVSKSLQSQRNSIQLAADYQEVVQWLLNVGLLPEGNIDGVNLSDEFLLVPFPYQAICSYYASQRTMLNDKRPEKGNPASVEELSCKYLFIDNFIEREFPNDALRKMWIENNSSGVYPPNSMQNLLRALLVPNISAEVKYVLLCYTFMDMTAVLGEGRYGGIVQNLIKFPAVFKLSSALIKRTQAFWFLDHGHIDGAIEELLSPMSQSEQFPHWQREFLISTLLRYDAAHLALRALRVPGMPISPFLELKTLLENNLISEAFKLQRSKHDRNLLRCFFEGTLKSAKYEVLLDLAMSEEETRTLREYLTTTQQPMADNVHFIHLLQKLDFVEAVHMVDRLGRKRSSEYNLEAPKEALTLYHAALEPTTQHLSYLAYAEQKDLKPSKSAYAEPLSSRLIRSRADFRNRIYHKSILAIKDAAAPLDYVQPFLEKPGLGMFQFHTQTKTSNVCYPIKLVAKVPKRKLDDDLTGTKHKAADIFIDYEKPTKRRKIESENPYSFVAPKSVLTEFRPMKPWFKFSSRNSECSSGKSFSRSPSAQLSTPLVEKMSTYNPPSPESVSSYTPHGILKSTTSVQSFLNRKSVSPTPISLPGQHRVGDGGEEKILRFDLPESPQVEKGELNFESPAVQSEPQNESMVSNDEFFSPEASVATLDDEDIKTILSSGPKSRRSIHSRSRSTSPVENNIAIIIEDVEDDSSSKQAAGSQSMEESMDFGEIASDEPTMPILTGPSAGKSLERLVLEANIRKALVAEMSKAEAKTDDEEDINVAEEKQTRFSDGPQPRRSVHSHSRSVTPEENNIAIIIEDVEDDPSGKQTESHLDEPMELGEKLLDQQEALPVNLDQPAAEEPLNSDVGKEPVAEMAAEVSETEIAEIESLLPKQDAGRQAEEADLVEYNATVSEEVSLLELEQDTVTEELLTDSIAAYESISEPVFVLDEEDDDLKEMRTESESSNAESHSEDDMDLVVDEASVAEDKIEIESDFEDDVDNSEASDSSVVEEVINISSGSESRADASDIDSDDESSSSSSSSSSSPSSADNKGDTTGKKPAVERTFADAEPASNNMEYADFYSDTVPELLMNPSNVEADAKNEESCDVQVSTTTSSTLHTGTASGVQVQLPQGEASTRNSENDENDSNKGHQAEDLSLQQEEIPEEGEAREQTPERLASRAKDLSVTGNERQEPAPSSAEIKLVSPVRDESFKHTTSEEKFLGPPKKAHEVDVPAMNLSVKPDVAHEANRKNSKSDESDDSAALNLSTGQIIERPQIDEEISESEGADVEEHLSLPTGQIIERPQVEAETSESDVAGVEEQTQLKAEASGLSQKQLEANVDDPMEGTSSRVIQLKSSEISSEQDDTQEMSSATETPDEQDKEAKKKTSETPASSETASKLPSKSPVSEVNTPSRRTRKMSTGSMDTSTPRSSIKTRRMSAIEELEHTPTKRATRASSLAPESRSAEPVSVKNTKHSSMTNLATPDDNSATPRRSTRASSLAKEVLMGTPTRRTRRTSESSTDVTGSKNVSPEEANDSIVDDNKSEVSHASTGSRRSTRRSTAARKLPLQPTISEESTEAASPKQSRSSSAHADEESFAEYTSNRRLTRHQSAIIEKSLDIVRKLNKSTEGDATSPSKSHGEADSESESVVSNISNASKRSTRSKTSQRSTGKPPSLRNKAKTAATSASGRSTRSSGSKRDNSDAESIDTDPADSPAKKSKLETIAEEEDESLTKGRRRGRRKNV